MSSWLNKLERRLEPFAISNITLYIVIAQTFVLLTVLMGAIDPNRLILVPAWVQGGEIWRLLTFVAIPPGFGILAAFGLYLFYLYGNALEQYFGVVRYNLFLLVGYVLTVAFAFVSPGSMATNLYLGGAVFLAFAFLNPDFTLHLFFILPVKIKWLALITWVFYGFTFVVGGASERLGVLGATVNFLLFFGKDIVQRIKSGRQRVERRAKQERLREELSGAMHTCSVCGRDSNKDTDIGFRYRTEGDKEVCYCEEHLPTKQS